MAGAAPAGPPPTHELFIRERNGCAVLRYDNNELTDTGFSSNGVDDMTFDGVGGSFITYNRKQDARVYDVETKEAKLVVDTQKVMGQAVSRKGTYVAFWVAPELEGKKENLFVYRVATKEKVGQLWAPLWPCIDWTGDDNITVINHPITGISFYEDLSKPPVNNVAGKWSTVSLSPTSPTGIVAVSIPLEKDRETVPTKINVFRYPKCDKNLISMQLKVDSATVVWNKKGTAALLNAGLDSDASGRSYYGEAALFLLNVQDKKTVPIPTDNTPIHDVQWNHNGKEFILIYGKMPSNEAKLIDDKGVTLHKFDISPKNTVHWSPHNRFFMIAGFGNLPGNMVLYDREKLGTPKEVIGKCNSGSVTKCAFSPCSRFFLCGTFHPRMTTANKVVIFKHNGEKLCEKGYGELYDASWRPHAPRNFPARDPSPPPALKAASPTAAAAAPAASSAPFRAAGSAPAAAAKPAAKGAFRAQGRTPGLADSIKSQLSANTKKPVAGHYAGTGRVNESFTTWRSPEEEKKTPQEKAAAKVPGAAVIPGLAPVEEKKKKESKPKKECEVEQNPIQDFSKKEYADVGKALSLAKKKVAQGGKLNNLAASELNADQVEKLKDFTNFKEEVKYLEALQKKGVKSQ